jgi:hypothetical protein
MDMLLGITKFIVRESNAMAQEPQNIDNLKGLEGAKFTEGGEVQLSDIQMKVIEEIENKARKRKDERSAREMMQRSLQERERIVREKRELEQIESAPERRTEQEIARDEERAMRVSDQMRKGLNRD